MHRKTYNLFKSRPCLGTTRKGKACRSVISPKNDGYKIGNCGKCIPPEEKSIKMRDVVDRFYLTSPDKIELEVIYDLLRNKRETCGENEECLLEALRDALSVFTHAFNSKDTKGEALRLLCVENPNERKAAELIMYCIQALCPTEYSPAWHKLHEKAFKYIAQEIPLSERSGTWDYVNGILESYADKLFPLIPDAKFSKNPEESINYLKHCYNLAHITAGIPDKELTSLFGSLLKKLSHHPPFQKLEDGYDLGQHKEWFKDKLSYISENSTSVLTSDYSDTNINIGISQFLSILQKFQLKMPKKAGMISGIISELGVPEDKHNLKRMVATIGDSLTPALLSASSLIPEIAEVIESRDIGSKELQAKASDTLKNGSKALDKESYKPTHHEKVVRCKYYTLKRKEICKNKTKRTYLDGWCGRCAGFPTPIFGLNCKKENMDYLQSLAFLWGATKDASDICYQGSQVAMPEGSHQIKAPEEFTDKARKTISLADKYHSIDMRVGHIAETQEEITQQEMNEELEENNPLYIWQQHAKQVKIGERGSWFNTNNHAVIDWSTKLEGADGFLLLDEEHREAIDEGLILNSAELLLENTQVAITCQEWKTSGTNEELAARTSSFVSDKERVRKTDVAAMLNGKYSKNKINSPFKLIEESGLPIENNGHISQEEVEDGVCVATLPVSQILGMIRKNRKEELWTKQLFGITHSGMGDEEAVLVETPPLNTSNNKAILMMPQPKEGGGDLINFTGQSVATHKLHGSRYKVIQENRTSKEDRDKAARENPLESSIMLDTQKLLLSLKIAEDNGSDVVNIAASSSMCYIDCTPDKDEGTLSMLWRPHVYENSPAPNDQYVNWRLPRSSDMDDTELKVRREASKITHRNKDQVKIYSASPPINLK